MNIIRDSAAERELTRLKGFRAGESHFPSSFVDERFRGVRKDVRHVLKEEVVIPESDEMRSTFGRHQLSVTLRPAEHGRSPKIVLNGKTIPTDILRLRRGTFDYLSYESEEGTRIDIVEHLWALIGIFHLQVDVIINTPGKNLRRVSMPTLRECNGIFIDGIAKAGMEEGESISPMMVQEPIVFTFDHGGYVLVEPPREGEKEDLILDQQVSYPQSIGTQRVVYNVTPETFAYLARARTPAHGWRAEAVSLLDGHVPWIDAHGENVILLPRGGVTNPRRDFFGNNGQYLELTAHETIDRLFPLIQSGRDRNARLVGRWTTFMVGHRHELEVIKALLDEKLAAGIRGIKKVA